MRHYIWLMVVTLLLAACSTIMPAATQTTASGVCVCHWMSTGIHDDVGCGYDATTTFHWRELEPSAGKFHFRDLDTFIRARPTKSVWLSIQTVGRNIDGNPKAPDWLLDMGAMWHGGTCTNGDGIIAPWDEVYVERLPLLLQAINDHISAQDAQYRATVAGVVIMSGGMYGEYQLWSCSMYDALRAYYGYAGFDDNYYAAVRNIVRIYAEAFPDMPLMLQVGTPPDDYPILDWFVREYVARAYVKWAGLDPSNVGDGRDQVRHDNNTRYGRLYRFYQQNGIPAHFGFEVGHPQFYQDPIGSGRWVNERFYNIFKWAEDAGAEFVFFQGIDALPALMHVPGWKEFDAALEGGDVRPTPTTVSTLTPKPVHTPTPSLRPSRTPTSRPPTPTTTPTRTRAITPTATATVTPTNTPMATRTPTTTNTPIPTSTPIVTSTPHVLRLVCEINLDTGEVRCWLTEIALRYFPVIYRGAKVAGE